MTLRQYLQSTSHRRARGWKVWGLFFGACWIGLVNLAPAYSPLVFLLFFGCAIFWMRASDKLPCPRCNQSLNELGKTATQAYTLPEPPFGLGISPARFHADMEAIGRCEFCGLRLDEEITAKAA